MKKYLVDTMIGRRFGKWEVIRRSAYPSRLKHYICRCDCEQEGAIAGSKLRQGKSTQCKICTAKNHKRALKREKKILPLMSIGKEIHKYFKCDDGCNELMNAIFEINKELRKELERAIGNMPEDAPGAYMSANHINLLRQYHIKVSPLVSKLVMHLLEYERDMDA